MIRKIGIVGWKTSDNSFGITLPYYELLTQYGDIQIIPITDNPPMDLDVLVLPGGPDISPSLYGEVPHIRTGNNDVCKEFFFTNNLKKYIGKTKIIGICLGMQQLNVFFGGKLHQHLDFPRSSPRWELNEELSFTKTGEEIFNIKKYKVNTLHHQSVYEEILSDELESLAYSKDFKNIEIFKHKHYDIFGFQYHPFL